MEAQHQHLLKPIHGVPRNHKNTHSRQRDLSCYYSLRENPKKKPQKSFGLQSLNSSSLMKKFLFRCGECGKGFRYEKCLTNHKEGMHLATNQNKAYEEDLIESLCSSFSLVKKKKRSPRVIRYKNTPLSCSFTTVLESHSVFAENDEEFEVAECMIHLSKSNPKSVVDGVLLVAEAMEAALKNPRNCLRSKKPRKGCEFESRVFENEQKLMEESVRSYKTASFFENDSRFLNPKQRKADNRESDETVKEPMGFLVHKYALNQQKLRNGCEFESRLHRTKLGVEVMECSDSDGGSNKKIVKGYKCESGQKKLLKGCDYESGFYRTDLGLGVMECSDSNGGSNKKSVKESASFLGYKSELGQKELLEGYDYESGFYRAELGVETMECSDSDGETSKINVDNHQCRLCNKIFPSYQALGGHQTFHRLRKSKKNCNEEKGSVEEIKGGECESVKKAHKCRICLKSFRSVYGLGGHKKSHGNKPYLKAEDDHLRLRIAMEFY